MSEDDDVWFCNDLWLSRIKAYGKFHPLMMIFCVSAKWETLMTLMQLLLA